MQESRRKTVGGRGTRKDTANLEWLPKVRMSAICREVSEGRQRAACAAEARFQPSESPLLTTVLPRIKRYERQMGALAINLAFHDISEKKKVRGV